MSRARRQLARRLEAKKAEATRNADPDAADSVALETANQLPDEPYEQMLDLNTGSNDDDDVDDSGLQITGLRTVGGIGGSASRFSGLFGGSDDSSSSGDDIGFDEDDAGRDETLGRPEGDYEDLDEPSSGSASRQRIQAVHRRPSTTEAKQRTPLDDEDDDDDDEAADLSQAFDSKLAMRSEGPFADPIDVDESTSSDEDELVEIRPRRTS